MDEPEHPNTQSEGSTIVIPKCHEQRRRAKMSVSGGPALTKMRGGGETSPPKKCQSERVGGGAGWGEDLPSQKSVSLMGLGLTFPNVKNDSRASTMQSVLFFFFLRKRRRPRDDFGKNPSG